MERVLLNKISWLKKKKPDWKIKIVTSDQENRQPFYSLPEGVDMVDLQINYSRGNSLVAIAKIIDFFCRRAIHKKRLAKLLNNEDADIVVTLYPSESSFIPKLKDKSKKILEFHYSKNFRLQYSRKWLMGLADRWRTNSDERLVRRFDRFVVLTHEDAESWGNADNMRVIPNAAMKLSTDSSDCSAHRVIAVGRLDYQKGFDRLIEAWHIIKASGRFPDWRLDIFGQGEWQDMLNKLISDYNLVDSVQINAPTNNIASEYVNSSLLVMSSNYEGFPMVMIEAMSLGLPVVSFDFKCGPRDIIQDGVNGKIVRNGDVSALAITMMELMKNDNLRIQMGKEAAKVTQTYAEDHVMKTWIDLFEEVVK